MKEKNKGFTLAELLIVVAIIGVLVAISIPIFTKQLEKAREAVDISNMRDAYAVASVEYYDLDQSSAWATGSTAYYMDKKVIPFAYDAGSSQLVSYEMAATVKPYMKGTSIDGGTADYMVADKSTGYKATMDKKDYTGILLVYIAEDGTIFEIWI